MSRKKTKRRHMTDEKFAELMKSAKQALEYERGENSRHRVTRIAVPRPPRAMSSADIARLRQQLKYSQSVFARVLNVSPKTVQAWEQGIRVPSAQRCSPIKRLRAGWRGERLGVFRMAQSVPATLTGSENYHNVGAPANVGSIYSES
jgi:putative transcriptional regulator